MGHCALILAGGMGSRLGYREKALIDIKGRPLIVLVIEKLKNVVDTIIVSVRDEAQGKMLESFLPGCRFAYDTYKNVGPLAGILSGLEACEDDLCFIAACDMPFINENVVTMLFEKSEHHDAAIPRWDDGFLEPLHAVYKRKPMLRETKKAVEKGETIILAPIFKLNVNYVPVEEIRKIDPGLRTFMNINTYHDIEQIIRNTRY
ncbi:MAG: molybdenum cofactor guanylyltransferase [Candidatus Methanoperedens sp.]|nr:molybdenum cofactor guanylyltransferase [Candidatus Methanoperedens sp.]MCZ7361689.1 molybdenum cofactor guanylyltransferase [Candidatus Methanoperedens sp.]HLB71889.1 molybdenum cofactor guanylyltransferase [Candidatus Methanoperedens sp.]